MSSSQGGIPDRLDAVDFATSVFPRRDSNQRR